MEQIVNQNEQDEELYGMSLYYQDKDILIIFFQRVLDVQRKNVPNLPSIHFNYGYEEKKLKMDEGLGLSSSITPQGIDYFPNSQTICRSSSAAGTVVININDPRAIIEALKQSCEDSVSVLFDFKRYGIYLPNHHKYVKVSSFTLKSF